MSHLVFPRQPIHFHQLVVVVEYQLDARQQVVSWFLVLQAVTLLVIFPQALQRLQPSNPQHS